MPGATETECFARADMLDTTVWQQAKDDPADVARSGFDAMLRGDGDVVSGWKNKLQAAVASVTPASILAEQHRKVSRAGVWPEQWRRVASTQRKYERAQSPRRK
jgi:short-subunit dehydrogenase